MAQMIVLARIIVFRLTFSINVGITWAENIMMRKIIRGK